MVIIIPQQFLVKGIPGSFSLCVFEWKATRTNEGAFYFDAHSQSYINQHAGAQTYHVRDLSLIFGRQAIDCFLQVLNYENILTKENHSLQCQYLIYLLMYTINNN